MNLRKENYEEKDSWLKCLKFYFLISLMLFEHRLKLPGTSGPKKKDEAPTQNLCEVCVCYLSINGDMTVCMWLLLFHFLIDLLMMQDDIGPVFAIDFSVNDILFSVFVIFQILL